MRWYVSTRTRLGLALGAASIMSVGLFLVSAAYDRSFSSFYLVWNLLLAWIPLGLMLWLEKILRRKLWSSWQALLTTAAFTVFLPNAFYVTTDIIHLQEITPADLVFDTVMFMSFVFNAFVLGLTSLFLFHAELRKRLSVRRSWALLQVLLLLTSFAIYIGRDLRWNTWDVLLNPASILFEVSDRLLAPWQHPELFSTTLGFFALITSMYTVVWFIGRALRQQKVGDAE